MTGSGEGGRGGGREEFGGVKDEERITPRGVLALYQMGTSDIFFGGL